MLASPLPLVKALDPSPGTPTPDTPDLCTEIRITARLAVPIALGQAGLIILGLIDMAIVGRTSVEELGAAALGRSILQAANCLAIGISFSLEPLAAQALRAGEPGRAWAAHRTVLRASALAALVGIAAAFGMTLALAPMGINPALIGRVRAFIAGGMAASVEPRPYASDAPWAQAPPLGDQGSSASASAPPSWSPAAWSSPWRLTRSSASSRRKAR